MSEHVLRHTDSDGDRLTITEGGGFLLVATTPRHGSGAAVGLPHEDAAPLLTHLLVEQASPEIRRAVELLYQGGAGDNLALAALVAGWVTGLMMPRVEAAQ